LLHARLGTWLTRRPDITEQLSLFSEHWSPKVVARLNDYEIKVVKVKGEFVWHTHDDTDELFIIVAGELSIQLHDGDESSWFCSGTHRAASSSTSGRSRTPTLPARQYPYTACTGRSPVRR